jgi:F-type H+-transporting ATPase subunit b
MIIASIIAAATAASAEAATADEGLLRVARDVGETFGFDSRLFFAQVISFSIVAFLLSRFAFKPLLKVLDERRRMIEEAHLNAERIKQTLAEAEQRYQETLSKANADAQRLIDEARASGSELSERKRQEAIIEAEAILAKARESTRRERDQMMAELRAELGRLVVETTGKVAGKVLTEADQRRLSEEAAKRVSA